MSLREIILSAGKALVLATFLILIMLTSGERAAAQALSFTVSNPVCVQAVPTNGACQILVRSVNASGDPNLAAVDISVDGKVRARFQTFFESAIYTNQRMLAPGLQVACGRPGSGGVASMGQLYQVQIQATFYGSGPLTDTASVYCPYYEGKVYLPSLRK